MSSSCQVPGCQLEIAGSATYEQTNTILTRHLMTHIVEELSGINWYLMHLAAKIPLPLPPEVQDEGGAAWNTGSAEAMPSASPTVQEPPRAVRPAGTVIRRAEATDE